MKAVKDHQNISISPMNLVIDLIQSDHGKIEKGVAGVWCLNLHTGKVETWRCGLRNYRNRWSRPIMGSNN